MAKSPTGEVEALRKDADRYRWLRACLCGDGPSIELAQAWAEGFQSTTDEIIDAAIDAAKEPK